MTSAIKLCETIELQAIISVIPEYVCQLNIKNVLYQYFMFAAKKAAMNMYLFLPALKYL